MTPSLAVSLTRSFEAAHALPRVGVAECHTHRYTVEAGYTQAIDPELGCARPMQDAAADLDRVIARVAGRDLNAILPGPSTAEILACWMLAQLAAYWEWVEIRAYDGFMCRVEREAIAPWIAALRESPT